MRRARRLGQFFSDLSRVNERYVRSPAFRQATMLTLSSPSTPLELSEATKREFAVTPAGARPYAGVSGAALSLSTIRVNTSVPAHVNLVLNQLDPAGIFAGVHTALRVASGLASRLCRPLRVILLSESVTEIELRAVTNELRRRLERQATTLTVIRRRDLLRMNCNPEDVWIGTHWTTAHALQVGSRSGTILRSQVIYLIQDYEPGFSALSSESLIAAGTYHEGFIPLVNSRPVASVLRKLEGLDIDDTSVFGPDLDFTRLATLAESRKTHETPTVMFYGRPSKPRNLFSLGVAALRVAASKLEPGSVRWVSAGEEHKPVSLTPGHELTSVGTLEWNEYFDFLPKVDVVLALQASPHPSHPPLESALSGAITITNEVSATRGELHPLLRAVTPDPEVLGAEIADAVTRGRKFGSAFVGSLPGLGGPLSEALDAIVLKFAD